MKLTAISIIMLTLIGSNVQADGGEGIVALKDDFSDGDIVSGTLWEAGDMHWFNPFTVENIQGKTWAGSKRYGSMGASFFAPGKTDWPISLDLSEGPISISFKVMFRSTSANDALNVGFIGAETGAHIRVVPDGQATVRFDTVNNEKLKRERIWMKIPELRPATPYDFEFVFSPEKGVTVSMDGKELFQLEEEKLAELKPFMNTFDRIAFMGANIAASNVPQLVPGVEEAAGLRWVTEIEVRGVPAKVRAEPQPPLEAKPNTVLMFCGIAALRNPEFGGLIDEGWTVERVYNHQPLRRDALQEFRQRLAPSSLKQYQWVIVFDISARTLGLKGCAQLKEYVRNGGRLLILGGACTLGRGLYFSSPLAECLPVTGSEGPESLRKISGETACQYAYDITAKDGSRRISENPPVFTASFGEGEVRVLPWSLSGTPTEPFWKTQKWLANLMK
jgi:hypothetical protein